jgi:uncharacterized membrane protein
LDFYDCWDRFDSHGPVRELIVADTSPIASRWLIWGQLLFLLSGLIRSTVLVPVQIFQARMVREFAKGQKIPKRYWQLARLWITWGVIATVPLIVATFAMVAKP